MIDYDALREALRDECYAACFGGGIGPAIMDALSVEDMSPEELLRPARMWGTLVVNHVLALFVNYVTTLYNSWHPCGSLIHNP